MVKVISDASNSGWGNILYSTECPKCTRDYWSPDELNAPGSIAVKEAKALHRPSQPMQEISLIVDAHVDNSNLIDFLNNEGRKTSH